MAIVGTIKQIWHYPVKSMFGVQVAATHIESKGIAADRNWALRDALSGEIVGGKKLPAIMQLKARYLESQEAGFEQIAEQPVEIEFPDGSVITSDNPYASAYISMFLGRSVTLSPRQPAREKQHYRLARPASVQDTRYALGIRPDEEDPDLSHFSLSLLSTLARYATPPGTYYDVYPLHFLTTASLRELSRQFPERDFRVERYRPSFLIETTSEYVGLAENQWQGCDLRIGSTVLRCNHPTIRCSMPGAAQPDIAADPGIPRAVMEAADRHLGAYGTPRASGEIRVGDEVELLQPRASVLRVTANLVGRNMRRALLRAMSASEPSSKASDASGSTGQHLPGFQRARIEKIVTESPTVRSFYLQPEGNAVERYLPGQHIILAISDPQTGKTSFRPYTVSKAFDSSPMLRISVKHELSADVDGADGHCSTLLHHNYVPGDFVWFKGPAGRFSILPTDTRPLTLISAGIGITPYIAMLQAVRADNSQRSVYLYHSIRDVEELAFRDELSDLQTALPNLEVQLNVTGGAMTPDIPGFTVQSGRIDLQQLHAQHAESDNAYFVCGKPDFTRHIRSALLSCGVPPDSIFCEQFGRPEQDLVSTDSFRVALARGYRELQWCGDRSLLEMLEDDGIVVPSGCRYGACQACQATLVQGEIEYPDGITAPGEKNKILLCCARPKSDITLDL
jgi:ferredoxin-NADP reductase/uncharacterized protein YcbX